MKFINFFFRRSSPAVFFLNFFQCKSVQISMLYYIFPYISVPRNFRNPKHIQISMLLFLSTSLLFNKEQLITLLSLSSFVAFYTLSSIFCNVCFFVPIRNSTLNLHLKKQSPLSKQNLFRNHEPKTKSFSNQMHVFKCTRIEQ